ncbi:MAG TPA: glycosyltransferase [Rhizomicrobium sp.]|nr:glycosyltransferase [Rhizomicrobium sp.]
MRDGAQWSGDRRGDLWRRIELPCAAARDAALYLARLFLPLWREGAELVVATADPSAENLAWLNAAYGPIRAIGVSREWLVAKVLCRFEREIADRAANALALERPALSAKRVVTNRQAAVLAATFGTFALAALLAPSRTLTVFVAAASLLFFASAFFRVFLSWVGGLPRPSAAAAASPDDPNLPVYSILAPLYREAEVAPDLVRALSALAYPKRLLDIKLIVEADDCETIAACERCAQGAPFEIVRVPAGGPRTKPKAANYALSRARGELVVIYDAEDRPEPDQLLKAVAAFRALPRRTACLQARLAFYNAEECWLTRLFALDYLLWFSTFLPGLERIGVPVPLGGTSNHFRAAVLREIGAWDPFNVTEDADIGLRLAQFGYRTAMLDSTTLEEAPNRIGAWTRQRARWLKGYMQTWLVHCRNPERAIGKVGVLGFAAFQLFIGGSVVLALVNPLLWTVFFLSLIAPSPAFAGLHSEALGSLSAIGAIGSNGLLTALAVSGPMRRGRSDLAPYGLTVTLYWLLISLAGYRALWHLITKPFHWDKTAHGLNALRRDAGDA